MIKEYIIKVACIGTASLFFVAPLQAVGAGSSASAPPAGGMGSTSSSTPTQSTAGSSGGSVASGPQNVSTFIIKNQKKTLFVLAFANDPITTMFLSYEIASVFRPKVNKDYWVLPEPAWTLADYALQCQNDSDGTVGALITYGENDNGTSNFLLVQGTYVRLHEVSEFLSCTSAKTFLKTSFAGITSENLTLTTTGTPNSQGSFPLTSGDSTKISVLPPPTISETYQNPSPAPSTKQNTISKTQSITSTKQSALSMTQSTTSTSQSTVSTTQNASSTKQDASSATQPLSSTQKAYTAPSIAVDTTVFTTTPKLEREWVNTSEIDGVSSRLTAAAGTALAALGAYWASHTVSKTNTVTENAPFNPGTSTQQGSYTYTSTSVNNNSELPYGIALLGSAFTPFSSLSIGAPNQTRILKNAASHVAFQIFGASGI